MIQNTAISQSILPLQDCLHSHKISHQRAYYKCSSAFCHSTCIGFISYEDYDKTTLRKVQKVLKDVVRQDDLEAAVIELSASHRLAKVSYKIFTSLLKRPISDTVRGEALIRSATQANPKALDLLLINGPIPDTYRDRSLLSFSTVEPFKPFVELKKRDKEITKCIELLLQKRIPQDTKEKIEVYLMCYAPSSLKILDKAIVETYRKDGR